MPMQKITIQASEHPTAVEALQRRDTSCDERAIMIGDKGGRVVRYLTLPRIEAERLEIAGVAFAYLCHHKPSGLIVTVPVNDGEPSIPGEMP